ncbi:MAG: DUF4105 domain-containing protein [Akkermansiaceae bacterium]|nr:DUF4105 domain-containing protein [Akkermansiaceae bacterium]
MSEETTSDHEPKRSSGGFFGWVLSILFTLIRSVVYLLGIVWAGGAIYFDAPVDSEIYRRILAIGFVMVVGIFLAGLGKPGRRFVGWALVMALVVVPWLMIKPSNEGDWVPASSKTPWAVIDRDTITFHNFRNFDYHPDGTVTERWEERTARLSNLCGLDYFHHALKGDLLAHPVLSFDFGEDGHVAFSVEVRYEEAQKFSPLAGLYRQFHLIYLVGDERDLVRERANVRKDKEGRVEPVRIYGPATTRSGSSACSGRPSRP